jgi:hypothetical protein
LSEHPSQTLGGTAVISSSTLVIASIDCSGGLNCRMLPDIPTRDDEMAVPRYNNSIAQGHDPIS